MVLYCIVIIVCMLVFYFIPKSKGKENEDITNEEDKKARSKTQVVFKFMINMILFFLLSIALFLLFVMSPVQWANPKQFNENTVDLIRVFALSGFLVNAVLIWQNKQNKKVICLALITSLYMAYKVVRTFLIF